MTSNSDKVSASIVPDLIWRVVDDNIVIVTPEAGDVHVLSQTGSEIWQLLADGKDASAIESYLVHKYTVSTEVAHHDVADFLRELATLGLLR